MMLGRLITLALLAGIIVPASSAIATPNPVNTDTGSIGIRLVDGTASSTRDPLARLYVIDRLAPGTSTQRRVEVSNSSDSTVVVSVYAAAAGFRHGAFQFAPGHSPNELSTWTSMSRGNLRLPPASKALETLTVCVPKNASAGERYAVIWAETAAPPAVASGIRLVNRVGVRMYVSVGPGGAPAANFSIGPLTAKRSPSGRPLVLAKVRNTGGRTLTIVGRLSLSRGPGGISAGPFPVKLRALIAPNTSGQVTVRLGRRLPRGPWRARMRLKSGLIQRVAVGTIQFSRQAGAKPARATNNPPGFRRVILIAILPLALAALALLLSGRMLRRRRRVRRATPITSA
jgi:hypothetical protein